MEELLKEPGQVAAIIPAGGTGQRFGPGQPKQFLDLAGWPVLAHTLARFDQATSIDQMVVVVPYELIGDVKKNIIKPFGFSKVKAVVPGGETRQASVYQGFLALDDDVDLVVIHDGVRPLVKVDTIDAVVAAARETGAAIAAVPVKDTLKRVEEGIVQITLPREQVWQAQTPQAFDRFLLAEALAEGRQAGFAGSDEAMLLERQGRPVRIVLGDVENIKITLPEDLVLAEAMIGGGKKEGTHRVGLGFDVHTLAKGRKLMLGGIQVPFDRGLVGHSDADVLIHALCDALLGAAGLGDIGQHFPDTDQNWAGAPGTYLLKLTAEIVRAAGYTLESADLTLLAQRPKIKDFMPKMVAAMAEALSVTPQRLSIKATTTEGLGAIGREEGLAAMAVALLSRRPH